MQNLNLIFNKLYYDKLGQRGFEESVKQYNQQIFSTRFDHAKDYESSAIATQTLVLQTTYPGMLIGTGNAHGSQKSDNDINMGFSFDYVSGQPYIPGSSVKGILRSHFKNHPEVVSDLLGNSDINVAMLEKEIFDGNDVFLDAVVFDGDEYGLLMGKDYITPHASPIKNPVPIFMIKILPDVRFEFRFILRNGLVSAEEKEALFCQLLTLFGVGAKTNVGYGFLKIAGTDIGTKKPLPEVESNVSRPKRQERQNTNTSAERVICPHCQTSNYKYSREGRLQNKCYKCKEFLRPRR